jgi:radical SAM superfamily enzyme YgiQ (UPF0313 family)
LGCTVCIGGPLVSSNPVEMMALSGADLAVIGEGEVRFAEICKGTPYDAVPGLAYRRDGQVVLTPPASLLPSLDDLPFPAYDLLPPFGIYKGRARKKPVGPIFTSRGCPYQCTYCNSSVYGKKFRARSPESVLQEIDLLVTRFGIRQLDVLDDNFTLDIARAEAILDGLIERRYGLFINLQNGVRADRLNQRIVHKMKLAGVFKVGIGVESGDEAVLRSVKKRLSLDKARDAIMMFRKEGVITYGFFMLGFPTDTHETVQKTIDWAIEANPTVATFTLLLPFPGTEMYRDLKAAGLLKDPHRIYYETGFLAGTLVHTSLNLSEEELARYVRDAYRKFNFRFTKALELLRDIRSWGELIWMIDAALPLLRQIVGLGRWRPRVRDLPPRPIRLSDRQWPCSAEWCDGGPSPGGRLERAATGRPSGRRP